jgi:hypothetical protein
MADGASIDGRVFTQTSISTISNTISIAPEPVDQNTLLTSAQTVSFPNSFASLSTTGGSGTGAVTFAVTAAGTANCSVTGTTLSYTSVGTCSVTSTKAATAYYNVASSAAQTFTVSTGTQSTLLTTDQTVIYTPSGDNFAALSTTG